jgi:hypothetical protein
MKNKLVALILSALFLLLTACSVPKKAISSDEQTDTSAAETKEIHYEASYLPDKDYEGYKFRIATMDDDICKVGVDEENGEVFNDSFYERNRIIEERYNVKIVQQSANPWNEQAALLRKSVNAGSDDFDLIRLIMREAFSALQEKMIAPVDSLTYCDLLQPWYITYINDKLKVGDKYTLAYTDECLSTYMYTAALFYNKALAEDYNTGNFYEMVRDGSWTLDNYMEAVSLVSSDINGDGKYDIENDLYGYIGRFDAAVSNYWVGSGMNTFIKDENNLPVFEVSENLYSLLEKLFEFENTDGIYYDFYPELVAGKTMDEIALHFTDCNCFFMMDSIQTCQYLRNMTDDFGLLPMPKYSEEQESYYSSVCDGYLNVAPITALDLERTSIILEELAVETKNIVMPAYVEMTLQQKALRDEDSIVMLDIILDTRTIDLGVTVWMNPVRTTIVDNCFAVGKSNFASAVAASQKVIDKTVSKAITNLTT